MNILFRATSLATLFRVSDSVRMLAIQGCEATESPGLWEDGFVDALNGNRVLEILSIHDSDIAYITPVVERLGSHPILEKLVFTGNSLGLLGGLLGERSRPSPATSNAIWSLLENRTSPTLNIECRCFEFDRESFLPIARGAIDGNLSNGGFAIKNCSFDEASTDLFETMFQPGSNLRSLGLQCGSFAKPTNAMFGTILHNDSPLKKLFVWGTGNVEGGSMVSAIMKALEVNTTLCILRFYGVADGVREALQTGLPKLRGLKELSCDGLHLDDAQRPGMMEAFKRNHSILKTTGILQAFPNEEDKKRLQFYMTRNRSIPILLENPARIPLSAWPKVFKIAEHCEFGANNDFPCAGGARGACRSTETVSKAPLFRIYVACPLN